MQLFPASEEDPSSEQPAADSTVLDIDKHWQAVHFLLTGEFCFAGESRSPLPLCNVVMGGTETQWESKHPQARASLGAAFFVAKKDGKTPDVGQMEIQFCSIRRMRRFLKEAVDELERRIAEVKPAVKEAKH